MEESSALLALCEGNPRVTSGFPSQRPVAWSFDVFFDLRLNKWLSKQSRRRWFETPSRLLWRHCNVLKTRGNHESSRNLKCNRNKIRHMKWFVPSGQFIHCVRQVDPCFQLPVTFQYSNTIFDLKFSAEIVNFKSIICLASYISWDNCYFFVASYQIFPGIIPFHHIYIEHAIVSIRNDGSIFVLNIFWSLFMLIIWHGTHFLTT